MTVPLKPKKFKLPSEAIAPIALGMGGCLATDRIVVDGRVVGYMLRTSPFNEQDSGWQFFAGDEDRRIDDESTEKVKMSPSTAMSCRSCPPSR